MSDRLLPTLARDLLLRRQRRTLVMQDLRFTGIDWVEVAQHAAASIRLSVHFVPSGHAAKPPIPPGIKPANIVVTPATGSGVAVYASTVHRSDHGTRTLSADIPVGIDALADEEAATFAVLEIQDIAQIDPLFARARFSLVPVRRTESDPAPPPGSAGATPFAPGINYLAKDFQSFRQLMLDQMAVLVPDWQETHPADIGNVVIDVLAYAADYLSYYQDAMATEAYLGTARRRVSVRRHARLLDYRMHEGCSARVWLRIEVSKDCTVKGGLRTVCDEPGALQDSFLIAGRVRPPRDGRAVFETIEPAALYREHNEIALYAWGTREFRVPAGATSAALRGHLDKLARGDVLIFASGARAAATAATTTWEGPCHAVRLAGQPRLTADPLTGETTTEIAWAAADALPFDLVVATPNGGAAAVAWGNIVAADAGLTVGGLGQEAELLEPEDDGRGRTRVRLPDADLVYAVPYDREIERHRPATAFTQIHPSDAVPAIMLKEVGASPDDDWTPRPDLLDSDRFARDFVVESDGDGVVTLRLGDDVHGLRPPPGTRLRAMYRTGRGDRNVGAMSIRSWDKRPGEEADEAIAAVSNPFPAGGGAARQPLREVRRDAPEAFRDLRQCVTAQDCAAFVATDPRVRAAVAQTRWLGSRRTVVIHVQPAQGGDLDRDLLADLSARLAVRRILGADFALRSPVYVPLRIALTLGVDRSHAADAVRRAVVAAVEDLYRFDRMQFGAPVFLSPLIARAMDVPGVADVTVDTFRRFGKPPLGERAAGRIDLAPTEIARLDNRPDAPDRGRLIVKAIAADAQESA